MTYFLLVGNLLLLLTGSAMMWSAVAITKFKDEYQDNFGELLTTEQESWIVSLLPLGAAVGSLLFNFLADKLGRKPTLLFIGVLYLVSYIMLAFGTELEVYYPAR